MNLEYIGECAIILRHEYTADGIQFLTPPEFSQQLGYMRRPLGYVIPAHRHNPVERAVTLTQETLFVKSGKVLAMIYGNDGVQIAKRILKAGDVILLAAGGHGFEILEEAEIIEVKQGPYAGDQDKSPLAVEGQSDV